MPYLVCHDLISGGDMEVWPESLIADAVWKASYLNFKLD